MKRRMKESQWPGEQLLTLAQMARVLQVSPATVGRQARKKAIPYVRVGGQIRFVPAEVLTALKKNS